MEFEPACRRMEWLDPFYKRVWEKAYADAIPISGTFELTPRCNFNCPMCYVHLQEDQIPKYGGELTAKEWIRLAQEAKEAGTVWLCITVGEPLLYPEFQTVYEELSQMGFFLTLQTNGYLLCRPEIIRLLEKWPPKTVKITLYSSNDGVYQDVCKISQGFTKVDQGIQQLREMEIPVQLVSTLIRQNADDIKGMVTYALTNKLPLAGTGNLYSSVRGANTDVNGVRVLEKVEEERKKRIQYRLEHPVDINRKPCTYCKDYRIGYWITWNGRMRFCGFMNEPNIGVEGVPFQEAWKQLVQYEENLTWPKECMTCKVNKVCVKCAGTLAAECGSVHSISESFCSRVKKYYDEERDRWKI